MLWTTNSTSLLAKTVAKENFNARHADLWEWGTFSEEVYVVNFPTSWMFIPFFVSFMDSFSFFSLPGTSGTVHRRERRSFYCLQLYKLSQRQLVLRNSRYWLSLALLGQISILNHIISSLSKAAVLKETYISSGTMEVVLKIPDGSTQLLQIVTEMENIRNRPHSTDDLYFLLTHWWGKTKGAGNCQSTSL